MKKEIYLLLISAFFSFNLIYAQNMGLDFDGTDDYVTANGVATTLNGSATLTMGAWFYCENVSSVDDQMIFAFNDATSGNISQLYIETGASELKYSGSSAATGSTLISDTWYHVAVTLDASDILKVYLNGIEDISTTETDRPDNGDRFSIAQEWDNSTASNFFYGKIDEVRIWNDVRTQTEIRANMYQELVGTESNLVAYYNCNATSGTSLTDNSTNSNTGTLTNMTDSDWTTSPAFFGPKNCLHFDGVNDNVWCPSFSPTLTSGTIEFWMNPDGLPNDNARLISNGPNYGTGDEIYLISGNGRIATAGSFVTGDDLASVDPIPSGVWTHVAITADGSGSKLYLNGVLDDTGGAAAFSFSSFRMGGQYTAYWETFDGKMDEVRVWNDIRTESEIRESMNKSLTGNETGLVAYYNFDNTSGSVLQNFPLIANDGALGGMDNSDWVASTAFNTWLNTDDTDWETAANWSDGVPVSTDNVGIYNLTGEDPVIGSSGTGDCNDLFIESGANLSIEDGGSLITNGTVSGDATIKKTIADTDWHLISVPNAVTTANSFYGDYIEPWDETTGSWSNLTETTDGINPVQGYGFKKQNGSGTYTFTGTPNTGDQSIAVTYTEVVATDYDGANLLGNPYPSPIDWDGLDDTWGSVYYWNGAAYVTWNNGSGTGSQYIAPMQGFFIVAGSAGTFSLTDANRTHSGASAFYKSANTISNGIVLTASNGSYLDELYLVFDEEASESFELQRDAYKMLSNTEGLSQLFSFNLETKFSIDVRPEGSIQLGFKNDKDGVYQIGLKELEGISGAYLEDTKLSIFHNLENGDYQFEWSTTDPEKRFKFHLNTTGLDDLKVDLAQLYTYQKTLYIQSQENLHNASVRIIDLRGREVYRQQLNNTQSESIALDLTNGAYTVVLSSDEGIETKKIIFN